MLLYARRLIIPLLMIFFTTNALSGTFPRGCEVTGFGYNENYLILNEHGEQTFYLLQNRVQPLKKRR